MKYAIIAALLAAVTTSHSYASDRISTVPASRFDEFDKDDARYSNDGITSMLEIPLLARDQAKDFEGYSVLMATCRDDETPTLNFSIEGRKQEGTYSGLALATVGVDDPKEYPMPAMVGGMQDKTLVVFKPGKDGIHDIIMNLYDESRIEFGIVQEDGNKLTLALASFRLSDTQKRALAKMSKACR